MKLKESKTTRKLDRRFAQAKKNYTDAELDIIREKLGLVSDRYLSRLVQRSPNGIRIIAIRRLHTNKTKNFLTAYDVAKELGIACSKTIILWKNKGWLKGKKSLVRAGRNLRWMFKEQDIILCLKARPWLCDPVTMPESYYRAIVRQEYQNDPWLNCEQAAPLLGVKTHDAVQKYINKGFLKADKAPGGPWQGRWVIRQSAIEKLLRRDPRPMQSEIMRSIRLDYSRRNGHPIKISSCWLIRCPICSQNVIVVAHPKLFGPSVLKQFTQIYTNGYCQHGAMVTLEKENNVAG